MERKTVSGIVLTLLAVSMLMTLLPVNASPMAVLSVQPTSIIDPTLVPYSFFRINITIADVEGIWGYQFVLSYNSTILMAIDAGENPDIPLNEGLWGFGENYVYHIRCGPWAWWEGFSTVDTVPLAWIEFVVLDVGTTTLHFDTLWTKLATIGGDAIMSPWNLVIFDGYFDNTGPVENTQHLIETIETWNLPTGTETSLIPKLEAAISLLDKGNTIGAIRKLNDFIKQVEALRGKKLTDEQADYLVSEAQRIIGLINA